MYVKPASDRRVPDPDKGGYLPAEGREVEETVYWLRREADRDVTRVTDEQKKQPISVEKGTEQ